MNEIEAIFFQECEEGLAGMESCFAALRSGDDDPETINTIFRHVHSIKGGAGAFGLERLQPYAHQYESLLDLVRAGKIGLDGDLLDLLLGAFDLLSDHVSAARDHLEAPADEAMIARLAARCENRPDPATAPQPAPALQPAETAAPSQMAASPDAAGQDEARAGPPADDFDDLMAMLEPPVRTDPAQSAWALEYRPLSDAMANGAEPLLALRELVSMDARAVECITDAVPGLDSLDPGVTYLRWTMQLPGNLAREDIEAVFDFMDDHCFVLARASDAPPEPVAAPVETGPGGPGDTPPRDDPPAAVAAPSAAPADPVIPADPATPADSGAGTQRAKPASPPVPATPVSQTIRVDLDRLDRLVNLVGELVITQAMLSQRLLDANADCSEELADLELLTRDLQESTMAIRAQPMKTVYSRIPRLIRDLEAETDKRVQLELEGEMTEVDKTVIERIGEPLTHLIRNAVDHGLESTEDRIAAGKNPQGLIRLSAAHQSGRIIISVSDDGRGIDRRKVRQRAIERGIVQADAILNDEEIDTLIFAPGFSTAEAVSNISGRGVGMDVVRKNIQALGGRIAITSRMGEGSTFSLSLPLTLAVLDGMVVTIGDQTMVIPLSHVVENVRPTAAMLEQYGDSGYLLNVRGSYVPVVSVGQALDVNSPLRDPLDCVLVVVDSDKGPAALMVDTISDQRQVVVKSLEANFQPVQGIAGATILGNGKVALIVDTHELVARHRGGKTAGAAIAEAA